MTPGPLAFGGLTLDTPLFLAPMAGLTHTALRSLVAGFGGAGCLFTEMLSARSLKYENPETSPFLMRTPIERPLCHQLLATTPEEAAGGAARVAGFGADAVDLNFGCPAPRVRSRGGGSKLAQDPALASKVMAAAARNSGGLPLSAKLRLGETTDEGALKEFCLGLVEGGAQLLHVHARLRGEPYGRKPRWEWIGKVKGWVSVPVVGNGSIFTVEDARNCLRQSGCDGLMIGRGAAQRPWLLKEIAREVFGKPLSSDPVDYPGTYRAFAQNLEERFLPERRLGRLKEFTKYFSLNYSFGHTLSSRVQGSATFEEALGRALEFLEKEKPTG